MPKHLVIVGGGHAHLTLLMRIREYVERGARVTVISSSPYQYYSGMGPGLLAGTYRPQDVRFHIRKTALDRGAAFIEDRVVCVEARDRTLRLQSGRTVTYDVVSFNTGSGVVVPARSTEAGRVRVIPVKPIVSLLAAQQTIVERMREGPVDIVVAGGGPAGVELAGNAWRLARNRRGHAHVMLVAGKKLLADYQDRVRNLARRSLLKRGVEIFDNAHIDRIEGNAALLASGERLRADIVLLATGIRPSSLFRESGLPVGADGGLLVDRFLRSAAYPEIFGGGDAICFEPRPLAKVGVYAVRQNELLYRNTLAALFGGAPAAFEPQRHFMLIFNMGDDRAILIKRNIVLDGRLAWMFKDRIDRSFMKKFQVSGEREEAT